MPLLGIENEIFAIICAISLIFLVFIYLFGWGKDFRKAKGDIFVFALNKTERYLGINGSDPADNRTLVMRAVEKHYPQLVEKYQRLFGPDGKLSSYYRQAFAEKVKGLCVQYGLRDRLF
ncbi:hypothetical protein K2F45_18705 [Sphingobacterium siyangense]|uniref:hypothetical protein n=1 Tax=Sphingobacterium siyangense TaxID=459529 RepID=UPI0020108512|nr:hypothetical protein [Sphingobacterium siyangense]UQA73832.1 hypothetical protein K2F45_18705 [Sphingobacterium siyangense]